MNTLNTLALTLGVIAIATTPLTAQRPELAAQQSPFWAALNDTTLDRLLGEALSGNYALQAAEASLDGAGAARLQAALELAPIVTAQGGFTRQRLASSTFPSLGGGSFPDQNLWDARVNASWEVDIFGRLRSNLSAQNALRESAAEDVVDAKISVAAQVARAYFGLRGIQGQLAVARRNAENQRRTLELTEQRLEAGQGNAFDAERARAQLNLTLAAIPTLEARVADAQYRIAVLVGRPPKAVAAELDELGELPQLPDSVPLPSVVDVRNRPDVLSAERQWAAGRAFVGAARADYLPRISLAANVGYTASAVDAFGRTGTLGYNFGPVVSWPLLDIGRVKARADEAAAFESEAEARYSEAVLVAEEEFQAASVRYRTARARLEYLAEAAAASERAASLAFERYEGGIADFFEVLDAERTLLAAQDQLAQGRTEAANAYAALYEALGGSWPQQ